MNEIEWKDEFSVGIVKIDEEHKRLIEMINKLLRGLSEKTPSKIVSELLTEMKDYAVMHFTTEEMLMERHQYPEREEHKFQHQEFINTIVSFYAKTLIDVEDLPQEILTYLHDWFVQHILESDKAYGSFFNEHGLI